MSTLGEKSVVHILCMILVIIMTLMPMIATESSVLSPVSSPSLPFHLLKDQMRGAEEHLPALEEDYGNWSPTPGYSGGNGAPIPHEGKPCFASLPSSLQNNAPLSNSLSEGT